MCHTLRFYLNESLPSKSSVPKHIHDVVYGALLSMTARYTSIFQTTPREFYIQSLGGNRLPSCPCPSTTPTSLVKDTHFYQRTIVTFLNTNATLLQSLSPRHQAVLESISEVPHQDRAIYRGLQLPRILTERSCSLKRSLIISS